MRLIVFLSLLLCCSAAKAADRVLICTDGLYGPADAGLILPHEHIFTDLRGPEMKGYGQAEEADVARVMRPLLDAAKRAGVSTIIECTTIGVGRNIPIVARLGHSAEVHIVVPTGVYGRAHY